MQHASACVPYNSVRTLKVSSPSPSSPRCFVGSMPLSSFHGVMFRLYCPKRVKHHRHIYLPGIIYNYTSRPKRVKHHFPVYYNRVPRGLNHHPVLTQKPSPNRGKHHFFLHNNRVPRGFNTNALHTWNPSILVLRINSEAAWPPPPST